MILEGCVRAGGRLLEGAGLGRSGPSALELWGQVEKDDNEACLR